MTPNPTSEQSSREQTAAIEKAASRHVSIDDYGQYVIQKQGFDAFVADIINELSTLSGQTAESGEAPDAQLCEFYQVSTFSDLVATMERHIEKLQAKLPRNDQPAFTRVREG